jgi:hypothetical protein
MRARTLDQLGSSTGGIWSRAEALAVVSRGRLQHALATGEWQEVLPGAFMDGGFEPTLVHRAVAAVLATGEELGAARSRIRAVACGRTAARVHGLPLLDDDDPSTGGKEHLLDDVHTFRARGGRWTTVEHGDRRLDRHRLTLLDGDLVHHPSGLVLTSALRTACDCARLLAFDAAVALVDHGLHRRLFTADDLAAALRQRTGWPGVRRLAEVVTAADGRAESPAETVARLVLLPALPCLVPQVRVRDRAGRVCARVDLGDEVTRFAVEVDGKQGHAGPVMVAKDRRRDRRTTDLDWHVERVTWHELRTRAAATRARVAEEHGRWQTRRSL